MYPDILPPHTADEEQALREDLERTRTLLVPVVLDERGDIIDGRLRSKICTELGIDWRTEPVHGLTDDEKSALRIRLNILRRATPPTRIQRHQYIEVLLKADPELSTASVATLVGVDPTTVGRAKTKLLQTQELPSANHTKGLDGKRRRVTRTNLRDKPSVKALGTVNGDGPKVIGIRNHLSVSDRAAILRSGKQSPEHGIVYTPPHIAQFLFHLLTPCCPKTVLDVAAGNGALSLPWQGVATVIKYELGFGSDFFRSPDFVDTDLTLCNPPFGNEKEFLRRIFNVVPQATPVAIIATHRVRLGSYSTSDDWRWCRDEWPPISSIVSLPRGIFRGVNETVEILLFRAPHLLPHYFLPACERIATEK